MRGKRRRRCSIPPCLKDHVNEFAYPALLAGLNFDFYKHAQGISLRISGYNDKQALLLEELLAVVAAPALTRALSTIFARI